MNDYSDFIIRGHTSAFPGKDLYDFSKVCTKTIASNCKASNFE